MRLAIIAQCIRDLIIDLQQAHDVINYLNDIASGRELPSVAVSLEREDLVLVLGLQLGDLRVLRLYVVVELVEDLCELGL